MRKIFSFFIIAEMLTYGAGAATGRSGAKSPAPSAKTSVGTPAPAKNNPARARTAAKPAVRSRSAMITAPATRKTSSVAARATIAQPIVIRKMPSVRARAAATDSIATTGGGASASTTSSTATTSTRTGAAYEQCKTAYFTCMDQFCAIKNEKYRRCSCSDKIYELDEQQKVLESAADQINEFNAGLDSVGMTAAQAAAMRTASEGEDAMASDKSASKRILSAIMNSISGSGETKVGGGVLEQLNSVTFNNAASMFGADSNGQQIASYNGSTLYNAIYSQCRTIARDNCTDDALQRAVTAYLMAVENDCGVVSKMIEDNRKKMSASVRESGAMLELARVENRQNQNSSDATTCLNEVEAAIKDPEVCGENYKKCLDNGEFINKDTGRPFAGVTDFYKLEDLLAFDSGAGVVDQKLTQIPANKTFVQNFVARNKKFAEPALGKCVEIQDAVWRDYLDKAMLEIHYAQAAKVEEIKAGCFDFVRECYVDGKKMVTDFMASIETVSGSALIPETISLTSELCEDYVQSCNLLFGGNIIQDYIAEVENKDTMTTCRNIAKECFDTYGGSRYVNFYNPASGLFSQGNALDWFTLYEYTDTVGDSSAATEPGKKIGDNRKIKSICAARLSEIAECTGTDPYGKDKLETIFGGVDKLLIQNNQHQNTGCYEYGIMKSGATETIRCDNTSMYGTNIKTFIAASEMRSTGVATEIYNNIMNNLRTNCRNYGGAFVEFRFMDHYSYCSRYNNSNSQPEADNQCAGQTPCAAMFNNSSGYYTLTDDYKISRTATENMCPYGYGNTVDTKSWGICSCWNNGGRRPNNYDKSPGCYEHIPDPDNQTYRAADKDADNKICPFKVDANNGSCFMTCTDPNRIETCNGKYDMTNVPTYKN